MAYLLGGKVDRHARFILGSFLFLLLLQAAAVPAAADFEGRSACMYACMYDL